MESIITVLKAESFGGILLVLTLILTLAPYLSGVNFGIFIIPPFNESTKKGLKFIEAEARDRSVTIRLELAECLPLVLGDAVQLQQVLLNLMRNSIESLMRAPGAERVMTISVREVEESEVQVTVRDTGQGIDQGLQEKIFDAFYTTKTNGMGMGLAISRSIIEAHGGRLWVESEAAGGTTFRFTLPVVKDDDR